METNNIVCPVCHWDKHLTDARFCQSCGTELINYCKNPDCVANESDNALANALPFDANYCPYCGSETTFYDHTCR